MVAELSGNLPGRSFGESIGCLLGIGPGTQTDLHLAILDIGGDDRVPGGGHAVMQTALGCRFGDTEDAYRPGHPLLTGALTQPGQYRFPEDGQAFPGRAGELCQGLAALLQPDARCGAV